MPTAHPTAPRFRMIPVLRAGLVAIVLCLLAGPAAAQGLRGVVMDAETGEPLPGALIQLLDLEGQIRDQAFSGEDGMFRIVVPAVAEWSIRASLIGYGDVESAPFEAGPRDRLDLEVLMEVEAVALDEEVVVRSRPGSMSPDVEAFYQRMDRGERSGLGEFIGRDDVERINPLEASDLLRMIHGVQVVSVRQHGAGRQVRMSGGSCSPAIYLDGAHVNRFPDFSIDDFVSAPSIEGIEVYRGSRQVGRFRDDTGCGLVLVWTRRGQFTDDREGRGWARMAAGAALFLGLLFLAR